MGMLAPAAYSIQHARVDGRRPLTDHGEIWIVLATSIMTNKRPARQYFPAHTNDTRLRRICATESLVSVQYGGQTSDSQEKSRVAPCTKP